MADAVHQTLVGGSVGRWEELAPQRQKPWMAALLTN